jgi:ADP-heptose:LPS heptosyltransferase
MLPEWQTVQRLLLCDGEGGEAKNLDLAVQTLQQALPTAEITLLTPHPGSFIGLYSKIQIASIAEWASDGQTLKETRDVAGMHSPLKLVQTIKAGAFDAAILFTSSSQSPYALAYVCYLAGIPIRLGQSREFGGAVLSACISPPLEAVSPVEYHLHLLKSAGFPILEKVEGDRNPSLNSAA